MYWPILMTGIFHCVINAIRLGILVYHFRFDYTAEWKTKARLKSWPKDLGMCRSPMWYVGFGIGLPPRSNASRRSVEFETILILLPRRFLTMLRFELLWVSEKGCVKLTRCVLGYLDVIVIMEFYVLSVFTHLRANWSPVKTMDSTFCLHQNIIKVAEVTFSGYFFVNRVSHKNNIIDRIDLVNIQLYSWIICIIIIIICIIIITQKKNVSTAEQLYLAT